MAPKPRRLTVMSPIVNCPEAAADGCEDICAPSG
jgi:hypothetical protein